jgi:predicted kinase
MIELIIARGLPGSGKTTRAMAWLDEDPENRARVSRDDLRAGIFGQSTGILSAKGEVEVTYVERKLVRHLLEAERSVVIDATHLRDDVIRYWSTVAAKFSATVTVWDMRDVPVDTCIARDALRGAAGGRLVGPDVIRRMHERRAASWQS